VLLFRRLSTLCRTHVARAHTHPTGTAGALEWCGAAAAQTLGSTRSLSSYTFSSFADAPPAAGSKAISINVSGDANVSVDVKAGSASAKASYPATSIKRSAATGAVIDVPSRRAPNFHVSARH
jgi:hypothetical protein